MMSHSESTSEECRRVLRRMELEAYGAVVSTLRAQGELNRDRRKLLRDLSQLLQISPERHKAEVRRAVNDEKLALIADRLSGSRETEWEWALEGRRVVPLMPRLLHPSPLTALATAVSKTVGQNPRICLNAVPTKEHRDDGPSKYVRDPDDEDTLSPVMVPVASPDSSFHHSLESEPAPLIDATPTEKAATPPPPPPPPPPPAPAPAAPPPPPASEPPKKVYDSGHQSAAKPLLVSVGSPSTKRPRSPVGQVVTVAPPLAKVRAVSPSCVRPPTASTPPARGLLLAPARPGAVQLQGAAGVGTGKIRVRAPLPAPASAAVGAAAGVAGTAPRLPAPANLRPAGAGYGVPRPLAPQSVQLNQTPRPLLSTSVKQVVQIRAAPVLQQQQTAAAAAAAAHAKDPSAGMARAGAGQTAANVASTIAKSLPGKANVIVLHKNSPVARNLVASRDGDRTVVTKASFLPKSVGAPLGAKMAFPGNVRIITVPSGAGAPSAAAAAAAAAAAKVVQTGHGNAAASLPQLGGRDCRPTQVIKSPGVLQKNVYVLELNNEELGKSIVLGDLSSLASGADVNGAAAASAAKTSVPPVANGSDLFTFEDLVGVGPAEGGAASASEAPPARTFQVEHGAVHGILDPQTGFFYTKSTSDTVAGGDGAAASAKDLFSSALASAEISLDAGAYADGADSTALFAVSSSSSSSASRPHSTGN